MSQAHSVIPLRQISQMKEMTLTPKCELGQDRVQGQQFKAKVSFVRQNLTNYK